MPKEKEEDQVIIRTDSESEAEAEPSSEPPPKKLQTASSSSSMPSRKASSSRKASREKEAKTGGSSAGGSSEKEILTPNGLQLLLSKITGGSGHQDSLVAIERLSINEILILKRRIAHYDIEGSRDMLGREIDHIYNRADMFSDGSDTTDTESPSNEV